MKIELMECSNEFDFKLIPENMADANKLLRLASNAKAEKPSIHASFSGDTLSCYMSVKKLSEKDRKNYI